jgi:hypothetical protein
MSQGQGWWGTFEVAVRETRRWRIGPSNLWISRGEGEWRIAREDVEDSLESEVDVAVDDHEPMRDDIQVSRYATSNPSNRLVLMPAMANRPVIVKSDRPFFVPRDQEVTLYISVPVWLRIQVGEEGIELDDTPIVRPSDTWFGPNTLSGELCYATRTRARLRLENLPARPHRAIVSATIRNHANSVLHLRRLKIPVGHLSLYASADAFLWTESLTLDRQEDTESAEVQLGDEPGQVEIVERLTGPRQHVSRGFLLDAFGGLFTKRGDKKDERVPRKPGAGPDPDV